MIIDIDSRDRQLLPDLLMIMQYIKFLLQSLHLYSKIGIKAPYLFLSTCSISTTNCVFASVTYLKTNLIFIFFAGQVRRKRFGSQSLQYKLIFNYNTIISIPKKSESEFAEFRMNRYLNDKKILTYKLWV